MNVTIYHELYRMQYHKHSILYGPSLNVSMYVSEMKLHTFIFVVGCCCALSLGGEFTN